MVLADVVQLVGVAIHIAGRKAFAYQVGVVVVLPTVVIGELVFQPSVTPDAVIAPERIKAQQLPMRAAFSPAFM